MRQLIAGANKRSLRWGEKERITEQLDKKKDRLKERNEEKDG